MKLSEYEGDAALDILAELIEPVAEICADKEVAEIFRKGGSKAAAIKAIIKKHKKSITTILAVLDGKDPETYKPNLFTLPVKLLEILNDEELVKLFTFAEQTGDAKSSGSASAKAG